MPMKMFRLWLVNQLGILALLVTIGGAMTLGALLKSHPMEPLTNHTRTILLVISAVVSIIPSILTAKFAKNNYDEMISSGFIRWTSSINLWKGEWKFFFKTLIVAFLFYGAIVLFLGISFCIWQNIN